MLRARLTKVWTAADVNILKSTDIYDIYPWCLSFIMTVFTQSSRTLDKFTVNTCMKYLSTYSLEVKVLSDRFIVTHRVLALILINFSHQNQTVFLLSLSSTVLFWLCLTPCPADRNVCFGYRSDTLSETGVKMQTGYLKCKNVATSHFCFIDSMIIRILVHTGWRQTRRPGSSSPAAFIQSINCWS